VTASVFDEIRRASARVMERARFVRIDEGRLHDLGEELLDLPPPADEFDPGHQRIDGDEATVAFIVTLNAINFGSGYFPHLKKRPGKSGYMTVSTCLRERSMRGGPFSATELEELDAAACAEIFEQDLAVPEAAELMALFAEALRDLGRYVRARHGGRFTELVEAAGGSADALVGSLASIPFYRDVVRYADFDVPFYKRAQITASDLSLAFGGRGPGAFRDIDELTIFADNLVPHVLRTRGVLVYREDLARRIDAGELIAAGAPEEVEIRAGAVEAVERCVADLRERGREMTAQRADQLLWTAGHSAEMKARPRHRTRTTFY
jgi:hypothetical protein